MNLFLAPDSFVSEVLYSLSLQLVMSFDSFLFCLLSTPRVAPAALDFWAFDGLCALSIFLSRGVLWCMCLGRRKGVLGFTAGVLPVL